MRGHVLESREKQNGDSLKLKKNLDELAVSHTKEEVTFVSTSCDES